LDPPGTRYAAAATSIFDPAEQVVEPLEEDFAIRVGLHTIQWESWPQCVAATRAGTRCLQPATPDNPGPHRNGAYLVEIRETYGSREAEVLRRLATQRCHLHDNATPAAIEFEGRVSASDEGWLAELQQAARTDAVRAEQTRQANRQQLTETKCPTCGVVGSPKCLQGSGQKKLSGFHMPRLQAAFGQTNQGRLPIV
jgi:hypothetical protein